MLQALFKSPFSHAIISIMIMAAASLLFFNATAGMAAGIFFYYGREVAQRQQEISEWLGVHRSSVWKEGWWPLSWETGKLDLAYPVVACILFRLILLAGE